MLSIYSHMAGSGCGRTGSHFVSVCWENILCVFFFATIASIKRDRDKKQTNVLSVTVNKHKNASVWPLTPATARLVAENKKYTSQDPFLPPSLCCCHPFFPPSVTTSIPPSLPTCLTTFVALETCDTLTCEPHGFLLAAHLTSAPLGSAAVRRLTH